MKTGTIALTLLGLGAVTIAALAIPDWHAPVHGTQIGPDGQGMAQFDDTSPWQVATAPAAGGSFDAAVHSTDPRMQAVTRAMVQLTQTINAKWRGHVGAQGVTCFTCHRNQAVPPETWFPSRPAPASAVIAGSENWNVNAQTVGHFFPDNGLALYLLHDEPIQVESRTAMRGDTVAPALVAKRVYEMMMQMSDGIGVNCGYCHSSRSFSDWKQSTPSRWAGYDAIRMTRDINWYLFDPAHGIAQTREFLQQNSLVVPADRRVAPAAPGLIVCASCHYGHPDPRFGAAPVRQAASR